MYVGDKHAGLVGRREIHFQCRTRLLVVRGNTETRRRGGKRKKGRKEERRGEKKMTCPHWRGGWGPLKSGAEIKSRADHFTGQVSLPSALFIKSCKRQQSRPNPAGLQLGAKTRINYWREGKINEASLRGGILTESYYGGGGGGGPNCGANIVQRSEQQKTRVNVTVFVLKIINSAFCSSTPKFSRFA